MLEIPIMNIWHLKEKILSIWLILFSCSNYSSQVINLVRHVIPSRISLRCICVWSFSPKTFLGAEHDRRSSEVHVALLQFISVCVSVCPRGVKLLFPRKFQREVPMVTRKSEATIIGLFFFFSLSFVWLLISVTLSVFSSLSLSLSLLCVCPFSIHWPSARLSYKQQLIPHTYKDLTLKMIFMSPGKALILLINTLSKIPACKIWTCTWCITPQVMAL